MDTEFSIAELADSAGVSPRTVRFYVQQQLLPPPAGAGRGSHYTPAHRDILRRIADYQRAGHSLDAIKHLLKGEAVPPPEPPRPARQAAFTARLLTHVALAEGVELAFDATRFDPDPAGLLALQELARNVFRLKTHD